MTKSLLLLSELLQEDKLDIKEVMSVLGYEIVEHEEVDVYKSSLRSVLIGYDETITIKKSHR
jgi:hypothetical protein